ncbi:MAG: hypothetical protein Q7S62_03330 [bacterium]|nr:hypothetical protein [bacterium]
MSNSSALRIKGDDLQQGMRVFLCNRRGEPLEQTKEGNPRMVHRVLYAPNGRQLALYPVGTPRIETFFSFGTRPDPSAWFAPVESFSLQKFPRDTQDIRVTVFFNEGLVRHPARQEDVLELVARNNGNGMPKFLTDTGEEYIVPEGAILIPTGKIG